LKDKEENALNILNELDKEREQVEMELSSVLLEIQELEAAEMEHFQQLNKLELEISEEFEEKQWLKFKNYFNSRRLEELEKTNVYNDSFRIWYDGPFGTINGLRLGRLPTENVEWSEINAALGQTLLLLYSLAKKLNFTFQGYQLVPLGNFSRIDKIDEHGGKSRYDLINNDKIGDKSIKFTSDESWTKALKYTLIDLKWILTFAVQNQK
ncbi:autophagy protein 6, partial [Clydaea vesicula]